MYIDPTPFGVEELSRTQMSSIHGGGGCLLAVAVVVVVVAPVPLVDA
jgi:hypothetical protein